MLELRLSTPEERKNIRVPEDRKIAEILQEHEVVTEGASINLDGIPLTREEINGRIGDLVVTETATLSVVVKTGNA